VLGLLGDLTETHEEAQISAGDGAKALFVIPLAQMGSLNAAEQTIPSRSWRKVIGRELPSADTLARVAQRVSLDEIRDVMAAHYAKLKRNKALPAPKHGLIALVLDGHETTSTYLRHCTTCLSRRVHTAEGEREQRYHRYVAASLVGEGFHMCLDIEEIGHGEGEVVAALRLVARVHAAYPRAYDVVMGDALYAQAPFFLAVLAQGKHALAVLKNEERDLYEDAMQLCAASEPVRFERLDGRRSVEAWDLCGMTSWDSLGQPARVVRTREKGRVRRQLDGEVEETSCEWMWVTTLPAAAASVQTVVELAHGRWDIENRTFNEGANEWHLDHVYRHEPAAMRAMLLLTMLAMNVFRAFVRLNLKPALRRRYTLRHLVRLVLAEILVDTPLVATG